MRRIPFLIVTTAVMAAAACGSGGSSDDGKADEKAKTLSVVVGDRAASTGPALTVL